MLVHGKWVPAATVQYVGFISDRFRESFENNPIVTKHRIYLELTDSDLDTLSSESFLEAAKAESHEALLKQLGSTIGNLLVSTLNAV